MITEKKLTYFMAVCQTENISQAAEQLFIAQPSLSRIIHELENDLGCSLFDRQGKHIKLNENGQIFYRYASNILASCNSAKDALMRKNHTDSDHFSLGVCVCSQLISDILNGFYQTHPNANITIRTGYPMTCNDDQLDLVLDAHPHITLTPAAPSDSVSDTCTFLMSEEICVAFSKDHPFAQKRELIRPDLYHYPCILPSENSRMGSLLSDLWNRYHLTPLNSASEINNSYVQCELVAQGRHFTILPVKSWYPSYRTNDLILAPLPDTRLYRHICLYRQPYIPPLAEEFQTYLKSYFPVA